ncbi:MAG: nucleotidyltransferase [Candidatus Omnitrophota bacterium]
MKEFIELLEKHQVEYVVVGGFAVNYYGYIRTTQDIDFLIFPSSQNSQKMIDALDDFGFGNAGITGDIFENAGNAVHLGVEPNRIDLLTNLKGVSNEEVFKKKKRVKYKNIFLNIIDLSDLLDCKRCSDRLKDLADVEELEKTIKEKTNE